MNNIARERRGRAVIGRALFGCLTALVVSVNARAGPVLHGRAVVSSRSLDVHGALFFKSVPLSALRSAEARIVDLDREPGLRPMVKLYGTGLPWYHSGWFVLKDRQKSIVVTNGRSKLAVYVPTTRGYAVLLSPDDPAGFLDALRRPTDAARDFSIGQSR